MINTRSYTSQEVVSNVESLAQQLSAIASKLNIIDSLEVDVATLKAQTSSTQQEETSHSTRNKGKNANVWQEEKKDNDNQCWPKNPPRQPHMKMEFPIFERGDLRGWILKTEKYFCYYQTPDDHKVDIVVV